MKRLPANASVEEFIPQEMHRFLGTFCDEDQPTLGRLRAIVKEAVSQYWLTKIKPHTETLQRIAAERTAAVKAINDLLVDEPDSSDEQQLFQEEENVL